MPYCLLTCLTHCLSFPIRRERQSKTAHRWKRVWTVGTLCLGMRCRSISASPAIPRVSVRDWLSPRIDPGNRSPQSLQIFACPFVLATILHGKWTYQSHSYHSLQQSTSLGACLGSRRHLDSTPARTGAQKRPTHRGSFWIFQPHLWICSLLSLIIFISGQRRRINENEKIVNLQKINTDIKTMKAQFKDVKTELLQRNQREKTEYEKKTHKKK